MVVRFVPVESQPVEAQHDRGELAEVIELRSRLVTRGDLEDPLEHAPTSKPTSKTTPVPHNEMPPPRQAVSSAAQRARREAPEVDPARLGDDARRVLGGRALSARELHEKLTGRGYDHDEVAAVIDEFIERHYLDDLSLARALRDKLRSGSGASPAQIRQKLSQRGIGHDDISIAVAELDTEDDDEIVRDLARSRAEKLRSVDRTTAERRLLGYLARRGWGGSHMMRIAREALDETH